MYLRAASLRHSHAITRRRPYNFIGLGQRLSAPAALYHGDSQSLSPSHNQGKGGQRQHGTYGEPKQSSVRPFTVLILCVPLGFVLSWALRDESQDQTFTSPDGFLRYRLKEKQPVSSTSAIFTLEPTTPSTVETSNHGLERAIKSVQIKQPQLQIARNYTPLPTTGTDKKEELRFLIRKEHNGEVSGYLHRLPVGSELELRGAVVDLVLPADVRSVVFLAGGTGIVPAMQVADALVNKAEVHILWANRRGEDCLGGKSDTPQHPGWTASLRKWFIAGDKARNSESQDASAKKNQIVLELEQLKQSSLRSASSELCLKTDYFIDEENTFISPDHIQQLLRSSHLSSPDSSAGRKLLLVSGPDGFVKHWAGAKQWVDGREVQGRLGGVLSTLDTAGWDIVKL